MDRAASGKNQWARVGIISVVLMSVSLIGFLLCYRWRTYYGIARTHEGNALIFEALAEIPRPGGFRLPDGHLLSFTGDDPSGTERSQAQFLCQYFKGLSEKYRHAASQPWKQVEPDRLLTIDDLPSRAPARRASVKNR